MERFVIIVNGWKPKRSILDVAAALDPLLYLMLHYFHVALFNVAPVDIALFDVAPCQYWTMWCGIISCCTMQILHYLMLHYLIMHNFDATLFDIRLFSLYYLIVRPFVWFALVIVPRFTVTVVAAFYYCTISIWCWTILMLNYLMLHYFHNALVVVALFDVTPWNYNTNRNNM